MARPAALPCANTLDLGDTVLVLTILIALLALALGWFAPVALCAAVRAASPARCRLHDAGTRPTLVCQLALCPVAPSCRGFRAHCRGRAAPIVPAARRGVARQPADRGRPGDTTASRNFAQKTAREILAGDGRGRFLACASGRRQPAAGLSPTGGSAADGMDKSLAEAGDLKRPVSLDCTRSTQEPKRRGSRRPRRDVPNC